MTMESVENRLSEIAIALAKMEAHNPTLRDKFAMAALMGILASSQGVMADRKLYSTVAYALAEAMLEERNT